MEKEIVFSKLNDFVVEQNNIDSVMKNEKWLCMPYEAGEIKGNLLLAGEMSAPADVTVRLNLNGWHKIFVSTINMKSSNYFLMRLTGDAGFTGMKSPTKGKKYMWTATEYAEEFFWKCANLSGEDVIISKPNGRFLNACCVAWIRCVPMTNSEIEEYKNRNNAGCIHAHIDEDPNAEDRHDCTQALLTRVYPLINTDIGSCSMEISFDYDTPVHKETVTILQKDDVWYKGDCEFQRVKDKAYKERINVLHDNGIKVYATNRMSVAEFTPPYSNPYWCLKAFPQNHPEYYCTMRDGSTVAVCSYAYKEVREHVISTLASYMRYGFDGVTLIFNRGLHIAFEAPVIERFLSKYPHVNPFLLPVKDNRLSGIWCEIMTEFMRELKEKLTETAGKTAAINVVVDYSPETSRDFGIDVESWAREGLINSVLQGNMEVFEDLNGCLETNGFINLEKYKEKIKREPIIKRYHDTDMEKVYDGAVKYNSICKKYSIGFYAALPWEHSVENSEYIEIMNKLRNIGIDKFHSWNTNHVMYDLPEFHAMSLSGKKDADKECYSVKYHRVLSLAGSNVSGFDPNWRG